MSLYLVNWWTVTTLSTAAIDKVGKYLIFCLVAQLTVNPQRWTPWETESLQNAFHLRFPRGLLATFCMLQAPSSVEHEHWNLYILSSVSTNNTPALLTSQSQSGHMKGVGLKFRSHPLQALQCLSVDLGWPFFKCIQCSCGVSANSDTVAVLAGLWWHWLFGI